MVKVVVIGSGLGGLTCAYILQRNGYDVTVLERSAQIGGCLQSFLRGGVKFDTGMHVIGSADEGQAMYGPLRYFGLADRVHLSRMDVSGYDTVSLCGECFRFPNGKEAFVEALGGRFPKQRDNLRRYVDVVSRVASAQAFGSLNSSGHKWAMNVEYRTRSIDDVLCELFDDELLRKVLVGNMPLYAAERGRTPFSLHAYVMDFYNQSAFRIVGGSDAIAQSLADSIREMGGHILVRKEAHRICCDDTKATGVETVDECFYPSDYVISAVHPARLLEMLDTKLIRPAFRSRLSGLRNTPGCFSLYVKFREGRMPYMNTNYFGYSVPSPWGCERYTEAEWPKSFLYMHHCHEDASSFARSGVVLSYMNMEDVARWKGTKVGHRGDDYEEFKRLHAERLIQEVERHQPGFTSAIESYYTSTPLTYLDYTGTEDGSMYGVSQDVASDILTRVPYRTKVPNLLLAGQNVNSHGVMGVLTGTIVTCCELVPPDKLQEQMSPPKW